MKIRARTFVLACFVAAGMFVCGCSSNSQPSIVGQWKSRTVSPHFDIEAMEVFENGTVVMQDDEGYSYQCNYAQEDNTIVYGKDTLVIAVLTESTLVLTEQDEDDALVLDRVKD